MARRSVCWGPREKHVGQQLEGGRVPEQRKQTICLGPLELLFPPASKGVGLPASAGNSDLGQLASGES